MGDATPHPIEVEDARFRWHRDERDVIGIEHFKVSAGERLFLVGPSGSGKTTLLSLLGGVILPTAGSIRILGTDMAQLPVGRRDRFRVDHVGFIFQLFNLVPYLPVLENVMLPCRFSARRRKRTLAHASSVEESARHLLAALELGEDVLLRRRVTDLSIGQQQRVAAARALIGAPEIVIADEPTSALDETTRTRFLTLLFAECERQNSSLVFVSHDRRLESLFDRSVSMGELNST